MESWEKYKCVTNGQRVGIQNLGIQNLVKKIMTNNIKSGESFMWNGHCKCLFILGI